jgi:hypothetical protein
LGKRGHDRDIYFEEGLMAQGEWNEHEQHGKEEVPGEWKRPLDVYKGWIRGIAASRASMLLVWHGFGK